MRTFVILLLAAALMISCDKSFVPDMTQDENLELKIPTNQSNNLTQAIPAQPGDNMKVFRGEGKIGFLFYDFETELEALVNVDYEAFCNLEAFADFISYQSIIKEDGENFRAIRQLKGENMQVHVWGLTGDRCYNWMNNVPLFSGTGNFVYTDNDVLPDKNDGNQMNSYGMSLHGDGISILAKFVYDKFEDRVIQRIVNIRVK